MEAIIVLLVIAVFLVPIGALITAIRAIKNAARAREQGDRLREEVELLRQQFILMQRGATPRTSTEEPMDATSGVGGTPHEGREEEPLKPSQAPQTKLRQPAFKPKPSLIPPELVMAQKATPPPTSPPPALSSLAEKLPTSINWERFLGVKLFAWVGGLALFLGVAFFVKYSFEHDLIPPAVRVALGFLTGAGLLAGGVVMKRKEYAVTSQTLCGTGVVILYAVSFACHSFYHFTGPVATFLLMTLVTVTAFVLAVQMDARLIAVLGLVGGFLTPPLMSTGVDRPLGLFSYIALLNLGLLAVAFKRRWHFLILLSAIGTAVIQVGWSIQFFRVEKVFIAMSVYLGFSLLFLGAFAIGVKIKQSTRWLSGSAMGLPFLALAFTLYLLSFNTLGERPGIIFSFALGADLCLLAMVCLRPALQLLYPIAGAVVFGVLTGWTAAHLTNPLLNWALGGYFGFAVLHAAFPVVLQRLRPGVVPAWWGHLFPLLALILMMFPLFKELDITSTLWVAVLLIDLLAILLALATASMLAIAGVLVLTMANAAVWLFKMPAELTGVPDLLTVVGGFALLFFGIGIFAAKKFAARAESEQGGSSSESATMDRFSAALPFPIQNLASQIPALSAVLPFVLLVMASIRLPLANPSPVFGLGLLLAVLLLGVVRATRMDLLAPIGLVCVLALQFAWHGQHFSPESSGIPLVWYLAFYALFTVFPFVCRQRMGSWNLSWAVTALSGPLHFFLVYRAVSLGYPNNYLGLLPAAFALPLLLGLVHLLRSLPVSDTNRNTLLAWFGGSALFFITLIFPIQFERQWLTIAWALEGMALLWLFHRVPHRGLQITGTALLAVAFARLALNPAVLTYHERSATPLLNWYLYSYGIATLCLMIGGRLTAPPRDRLGPLRLGRLRLPALLYTLGVIMAFLLVNIEIADYFGAGPRLRFQFSGDFARDMTYSIAWALFALVLLIVGIRKQIAAARYASLGLLGVTLVKLFFHDLSQLGQLYRIGAFITVAVILILASFLYQRFLARGDGGEKPESSEK